MIGFKPTNRNLYNHTMQQIIASAIANFIYWQ